MNQVEIEKVCQLLVDLGFIVESIDIDAERFTIRTKPTRENK